MVKIRQLWLKSLYEMKMKVMTRLTSSVLCLGYGVRAGIFGKWSVLSSYHQHRSKPPPRTPLPLSYPSLLTPSPSPLLAYTLRRDKTCEYFINHSLVSSHINKPHDDHETIKILCLHYLHIRL